MAPVSFNVAGNAHKMVAWKSQAKRFKRLHKDVPCPSQLECNICIILENDIRKKVLITLIYTRDMEKKG